MRLTYEILFTIELLHDYYQSKQMLDIEVVPTEQTAILLNNQGALCKKIGNKLLLAVNANDSGEPFKALSAEKKLSFYLKIRNGNFANITNLDFQPSGSAKFYFSNLSDNEQGTCNYLHKPVAKYDAATTYLPGALASDAGNKIFEAIKTSRKKTATDAIDTAHALSDTAYWKPAIKPYDDKLNYDPYAYAANAAGEVFMALKHSDAVNKHTLTEVAFWLPIGKIQYATKDDLLSLSGPIYNFTLATAAKEFMVEVFGLNKLTNVYDVPAMRSANYSYADLQSSVPVRLNGLPPGRYKVSVNGEEQEIYYDDIAAYENIFGIIDIFNHLPDADAFSLMNAGKLKSTAFLLHFASRSVIWKYIARTDDVTSVKDSSLVYTFSADGTNQFISDVPIPFSETPLSSLFIESNMHGNIKSIPNPPINRLGSIKNVDDVYFCAETYLNY